MMPSAEPCYLLLLPLEVRQVIYRQLLTNLTVHICADGNVPSPSHPTRGFEHFVNNLMTCSSNHYRSLLRPGKWSSVCSPYYTYTTNDLLSFLLSCKKIHLEFEPLLWSSIEFAIGLAHFGNFFKRFLTLPLRLRLPAFIPRFNMLQRILLALPRSDELASELGHDLRYTNIDANQCIDKNNELSLTHLTLHCLGLRSLTMVMDASQLEAQQDLHQIIAWVRTDIETVLRFRNLKYFNVLYARSFPHTAAGGISLIFRIQLETSERVARKMVTGKGTLTMKDDSLFSSQLVEQYSTSASTTSRFEDDSPQLREFCDRVAGEYGEWWRGIPADQRGMLLAQHIENSELRARAAVMEAWMLANQI